jgi:hypothetical protein
MCEGIAIRVLRELHGPTDYLSIGIQGGTAERVSGLAGDDIIGLAVVSPGESS